jgi:hypothetical protein
MSRLAPAAVLFLVAAMTSGCVIHVGDDGEGYYSRGDRHRQEVVNRNVISQLALGTTVEQVRQRLGEPDFSEAWLSEGVEVRVLRYRTHRTSADGDTTIDETTPLVFRAGRLVGIGEQAAAQPVSGAVEPGGDAMQAWCCYL